MSVDGQELPVPVALRQRYDDWQWELVYRNERGPLTYRLSAAGQHRFLKLAPVGGYPPLAAERERLRWARPFLPVPSIVEHGASPEVEWTVTEALPGSDGTRAPWRSRPRELVRRLATGLKVFHSAPVTSCPFDFRLDVALRHASRRLRLGMVDPVRDFHPEHAHLTAEEAVSRLLALRPVPEDLVVCHGDYCVPNIIHDEDGGIGFVDVGELGVADRWWDLSVATWSLEWNLGPGHEDEFLEVYGVERDESRMAYYRLLYDVVS